MPSNVTYSYADLRLEFETESELKFESEVELEFESEVELEFEWEVELEFESEAGHTYGCYFLRVVSEWI